MLIEVIGAASMTGGNVECGQTRSLSAGAHLVAPSSGTVTAQVPALILSFSRTQNHHPVRWHTETKTKAPCTCPRSAATAYPSVCASCPAGQYRSGCAGSSAGTCLPCPAGHCALFSPHLYHPPSSRCFLPLPLVLPPSLSTPLLSSLVLSLASPAPPLPFMLCMLCLISAIDTRREENGEAFALHVTRPSFVPPSPVPPSPTVSALLPLPPAFSRDLPALRGLSLRRMPSLVWGLRRSADSTGRVASSTPLGGGPHSFA